jgi:hypothetical protein
MIRRAQFEAESIATLAAEYQSIAAKAQDQRWSDLLVRSGLTETQVSAVKDSPAYGPLVAALRDAEARDLDVDAAFPALVRGRTLVNADDVAAVLHSRVDNWLGHVPKRGDRTEYLVAGLFPRARGVVGTDMKRGLTERDNAIENRSISLAVQGIKNHEGWTSRLGRTPRDPSRRTDWLGAAATVAAYRERWAIGADPRPLGSPKTVTSMEQYGQYKRALAALQRAIDLSRGPLPGVNDPFVAVAPAVQREPERGIEL